MHTTLWPYQTVETRNFLRRLSPYMPEQIDVFQTTTGRYGQLRGLPFTQVGEKAVAHVHWYLTDEAKAATTADDDVAGNLLPCLYGFQDLATEILLPDRRRVVPACELTNMVREEHGWQSPAVKASIVGEDGDQVVFIESAYGTVLSEFTDKCFSEGRLAGRIEQLLRSLHFAVGFAPHQYHRRIVGFDYSTGLKPGKS